MKIAILHLSDLHIENRSAIHMENVNALTKSLSALGLFKGVILAFSGDIAAKGQKNNYKLSSLFVSSLISNIKSEYKIVQDNIKVLITPGNHDMDRQVSPQCERADVETWHKNHTIAEHIDYELDRMDNFFEFSGQQGCFVTKENRIFTRKILHFSQEDCDEKYRVEANLFNSAIFSSDKDNGIHYFPNEIFDNFKKSSPTSFSLAIMHHSPDWYWPEQKVQLHELLYGRCNLVLYGHEHYESNQRILQNQNGVTLVQAGGAWWENDFSSSSYYVGVLDTTSRKYQQYKFAWCIKERFYEHKDCTDEILPFKCCNGSHLAPTAHYLKSLLEDEKQWVCGDISRYFIFPKLKSENAEDYDGDREIQTQDELIRLIESKRQIMIVGSEASGKTTLMRMLFLGLSQKYTVLLCGIKEVSGKLQKNIIRETFCDIYGLEPEKRALFEQQSDKEKIILIDDAHLIKPEHLEKLLKGLRQVFGHVIVAGEKNNTFDVHEQISRKLELESGICQFAIAKFYANKRRELIRKIIEVCTVDSMQHIDELEFNIDQAISNQKLSYKLDPDFIVKFTSYYCAHMRELRSGNLNVFSKVFEASIEIAIEPHLRRETIGQIKTALGDVAHYIHFGKHYPIEEQAISEVVNAYASRYDEPLQPLRFLEITAAANLLVRCEDSLSYRFKNKDYLAYFTAEAVSRRFNEKNPQADNDLCHIIEYSCFSINPTILKFIAYTTGDIRVIEMLIRQAISYVKEWVPYDLDKSQMSYLKNMTEDDRKKISDDTKKEEIEAKSRIEEHLDTVDIDRVQTIDIYDYNENEVNTLNNQLIRALLQMNVISSCLTTFSHMMPADTKRELISSLYDMPNQIFNQWATEIDNNLDLVINGFLNEKEESFASKAKDERQKIMVELEQLSMGLLLNLYYTISNQCAVPSTIDNLTRSQYVVNTNHRLERLMFYERTDRWAEFIKEAESLYEKTSSGMVKNMIVSMVYHILTWSPSMPPPKKQHLMDQFNLKAKRKNILLQSN